MTTKAVYLKLPQKLYSDMNKIKKEFGFQNLQEFLRDAARKAIAEYETQMSIRRIKKLQGSVPYIKRLTKKDKEKIAKEIMNQDLEEVNSVLAELNL